MLRLGLTGGIASGKSTVSAMLRDLGFTVLDADSMAHELMEPGCRAYDEIVREFGAAVLGADKKVDRRALAKIVFADPAKLQKLNAIVHPRVEEKIISRLVELKREGSHCAVFVEAALIIEAGLDKKLDGVVVVWCKPEQQIERLVARGFSAEDARRRMAAQLPVEEKVRQATETIDCSGPMAETKRQVEQLATKLRGMRPTH
jgi:dephospho-CoA kinase